MLDCGACYRQLADAGVPDQVVLNFRTTPAGADVIMDGQKIGVTPMAATIATGKDRTFLLAKVGYISAVQSFRPVTNGYVWARLQKDPGGPPPIAPPRANFTTDEPRLGGFPLTVVVLGAIGLGLTGYLAYRVARK